jgi:hypothetical protein
VDRACLHSRTEDGAGQLITRRWLIVQIGHHRQCPGPEERFPRSH